MRYVTVCVQSGRGRIALVSARHVLMVSKCPMTVGDVFDALLIMLASTVSARDATKEANPMMT